MCRYVQKGKNSAADSSIEIKRNISVYRLLVISIIFNLRKEADSFRNVVRF